MSHALDDVINFLDDLIWMTGNRRASRSARICFSGPAVDRMKTMHAALLIERGAEPDSQAPIPVIQQHLVRRDH